MTIKEPELPKTEDATPPAAARESGVPGAGQAPASSDVASGNVQYRDDVLEAAAAGEERWREESGRVQAKRPFWKQDFTTVSGMEVPQLVTAVDTADLDPAAQIGVPGEFPYTRGIHPTGYRGKLWTMRQFAGFGSAADTNRRFKYLLEQGQTGLSVAFHLPTLYGYDSDHPMSLGEVGKCGVAIDTLADMEALFAGIPLDEVSTSMTINSTAPILFAMYLAVAEKQGVDVERHVTGTLQNDILKEYIAQKEYIYPPRPSMRLITDQFAFAARARAALEHHLDLRLPHPRGRLDGAPGAGVHPARRHGVRAVRHRRRPRRRRLRAAAVVLLQQPQRLLRGDRQVPGGAPDLGDGDARALRRQGPALADAALPHPDRRLLAHRPAADQQRRADDAAGAGGGARRHPVAAHQRARRDPRPAHRGDRPHGAADAADHRPRVRRHQHRRPARRLLLRRGDDPPHGRRRLRLHPPHRRARRHGGGGRGRLPAARDRRGLLRVPEGGGGGAEAGSSASTPSR